MRIQNMLNNTERPRERGEGKENARPSATLGFREGDREYRIDFYLSSGRTEQRIWSQPESDFRPISSLQRIYFSHDFRELFSRIIRGHAFRKSTDIESKRNLPAGIRPRKRDIPGLHVSGETGGE